MTTVNAFQVLEARASASKAGSTEANRLGSGALSGGGQRVAETDDAPQSLKEVASRFEETFVRQFVKRMTEEMFSSSLSAEEGGGWMKSQRARQRRKMTGMIAKQIAESGELQISQRLLDRWKGQQGREKGRPLSEGGSDAVHLPSIMPEEALKPGRALKLESTAKLEAGSRTAEKGSNRSFRGLHPRGAEQKRETSGDVANMSDEGPPHRGISTQGQYVDHEI